MGETLLRISHLVVEARSESDHIRAVDDVSIEIDKGEVVGLIGESGSGKTTLIRSILDLHERNVSITAGTIEFDGEVIYDHDGHVRKNSEIRGSRIGMVFQQPRASLNPLRTIKAHLREVLRTHKKSLSRADVREISRRVIVEMGLEPDRVLASFPHQLSGGMCQRCAIAIAISTSPDLIIADECTSALDVTSQAEVVEVLRQMTRDSHRAMLFITHDMLLASELCDRLIVMKSGKVVEQGPTAQVLEHPREQYTKELIAAVPRWTGSN